MNHTITGVPSTLPKPGYMHVEVTSTCMETQWCKARKCGMWNWKQKQKQWSEVHACSSDTL